MRVKGPYVNMNVQTLMLLEPWLMILAYVYIYCDGMGCVACLIYCSFAKRISCMI
jgi:hypothetical protein